MPSKGSKIGWTVVFIALAAACSDGAQKAQPAAVVSEPKRNAASADEAPAGRTYSFSPSDSAIRFVGAKVTREHQGSFGAFKGRIDLVDERPEASSVRVDIEMSSLESDEAKLTEHLKSPDLLDVSRYPRARFVSTSIAKAQSGYLVTGDFELHGVRKSIQFPADIRVGPGGVEADAEFRFKRQDFGITYPGMPDDLIRDDVQIKLALRAKPDAA